MHINDLQPRLIQQGIPLVPGSLQGAKGVHHQHVQKGRLPGRALLGHHDLVDDQPRLRAHGCHDILKNPDAVGIRPVMQHVAQVVQLGVGDVEC